MNSVMMERWEAVGSERQEDAAKEMERKRNLTALEY